LIDWSLTALSAQYGYIVPSEDCSKPVETRHGKIIYCCNTTRLL